MNTYFDITDIENSPTYYIFMGGRGYAKRIKYIAFMCEILFGGESSISYDTEYNCTYITILNDDIDVYTFIIYDETLEYEMLSVRLNRMCEEYDAYMRYKYRDSKEYLDEMQRNTKTKK